MIFHSAILITLDFQIPLRFDQIEVVSYRSLNCDIYDESQMRHICNNKHNYQGKEKITFLTT